MDALAVRGLGHFRVALLATFRRFSADFCPAQQSIRDLDRKILA
jgi:hypothetical protein